MKEKTIIIKLTPKELDVLKQIFKNYLNLLSITFMSDGSELARLFSKFLTYNGDKGFS